ncbi:MAG: type IIA DNA topoisomerase subunit B [Proteobacteria bacterium]|nr:type IIA DNA topoisomerase subunit B [Pseudomonadota bacterium]NDB71334.1 type IIA DNA topoisomerase subunit B [Pseudomonadota bacterium]NDF07433.1 type IIA DNA topoisomerase subunit B [Pseudomonadota bacterium]NDG96323.1 type IIA DNA topoisomerase subunit B [Pseudomonadota bacterium]
MEPPVFEVVTERLVGGVGSEVAVSEPRVAAISERRSRAKATPPGTGQTYTGADIQVLEGVAAIRRRPGMYIGSTSTSGLCHLIYEAVDNAVDEANAGHGKHVLVRIDKDGWVTVRDQARGIPIDPKEYQGRMLPAATIILTVPHSGGKFEEGAYKTAGGLHGVGATVINALSQELHLTIWRDGVCFTQEFRHGEARPHRTRQLAPFERARTGTEFRWRHDTTIFDPDATYAIDLIEGRLQAAAYLNRGLEIEFTFWDPDAEAMVTRTYLSREGVADFVRYLTPPDSTSLYKAPITILRTREDPGLGQVQVEVSLLPNTGYRTTIHSFANGVRTRDGGVHESGCKAALTRVLNDQALRAGVLKERDKGGFKPDVIQQGLVAVISVKLGNPQFQGQTKERLNNAPVEGIVRSAVDEGLKDWFETVPDRGRDWLRKVNDMQRARNEAMLVEELARTGTRKGGELIDTSVSKKFIPCITKDRARSELLIVEGDSAGGSASQGRFSEFQAILKLRGKPLNVAKADLKRVVENEEIRTIISVLGCGTRASFDHSRLKFGKIVILTDADVDGLHIQCLLLTLFFQEFATLIERGHVYIGTPPLYSVTWKGKTTWLIDDEARARWQSQHRGAEGLEFRRYKGLGEMTARQLRDTTLDPAHRVLRQVTLEDAVVAANLVSALMEEGNAEQRRHYLAKNARQIGDLDV